MSAIRILSVLWFFLCNVTLAQQKKTAPKPEEHTLIIVSTADMHACIERFPKLATLVKTLRAQYRHVLLIDTGDRFTGNAFVDNAATPGAPITELMNKLRYDIGAIGAHDFDYGIERLREHIMQSPKTQYVATNVVKVATKLEDCLTAHHVHQLKDTNITVGFVGLTDLRNADRRKIGRLLWKRPSEADFKNITDKFRLHKNTINVVLSHLGYENDLQMMRYTPNIDLIIGGKTHVILPNGMNKTGTLLCHTGSRLRHVGVTKIVFSAGENPEALSKSTETVELNDQIPDDPEFLSMVKGYTSDPSFSRRLAQANENIRPATLAHTFCKAIQQSAKADLVLYNRGRIHSRQGIKKGDVTLKDIYNLEPYREYIVTCKMTKKDIEQLILSRFTAGNSEKGDMFDIYCCGFTYQVLAGSSTTITSSLKDGVTYTVAMGDYMCYNYDFPQKSEGKSTRISVRQALISYIKEKKILVNTPPPKPPII